MSCDIDADCCCRGYLHCATRDQENFLTKDDSCDAGEGVILDVHCSDQQCACCQISDWNADPEDDGVDDCCNLGKARAGCPNCNNSGTANYGMLTLNLILIGTHFIFF